MWRYVEDEAKKANEATVGGQGEVGRKGVRDGEDSRPQEAEEEEEEVQEEEEEADTGVGGAGLSRRVYSNALNEVEAGEEEEEEEDEEEDDDLAPASACRSWKPKPVEQVRESRGVYTLTCTLHPTVSTPNPSEAT
jgi:hypothetical protein